MRAARGAAEGPPVRPVGAWCWSVSGAAKAGRESALGRQAQGPGRKGRPPTHSRLVPPCRERHDKKCSLPPGRLNPALPALPHAVQFNISFNYVVTSRVTLAASPSA